MWCKICSGHVDPGNLVVYSRPDPTVWCNRRPPPMKEYEFLFAEASSFPRLAGAFAAYLGKDKVA